MPFVQVHLSDTYTHNQKTTISKSIQQSLMEFFEVPEQDYFQVFNSLTSENIIYPDSYLEIPHTDRIIYIQIVCGTGRALKNKIALYKSIAEKIVAGTGITSDDVFIVLSETAWENWSFGRGEAQKAKIFGQ